jgi:hypothetical protein
MLTEKMFYYGAAIWALVFAGWRTPTAALAIAALLSGIEYAQRACREQQNRRIRCLRAP